MMDDRTGFVNESPSRTSWFEREGVLSQVRRLLAERCSEGYLVGGYVRDQLLGRDTRDLDLVVRADALALAREAANRLGGAFVLLDEERQTGRVVLRDEGARYYVDFATMRGDGMLADLGGRDFTVNAMAIDLLDAAPQPEILDPFEGQRDLERGTLRAVSDSVFRDDAIRLLRAVRLAAELGLKMEADTEQAVVRDAHLVAQVSAERVRDELCQILAVGGAEAHLRYLDRLGLLGYLIPELDGLRGVEQPLPHREDAFQHSLSSAGAMDWVVQAMDRAARGQEMPDVERWGAGEEVQEYFRAAVGPFSQQLVRYLAEELVDERRRSVLLQLAALLHDSGKASTGRIDDDGRIRFFGHAREGAGVAARVLRRLHFGTREVRLVQMAVRHHMRPLHLARLERISDRAVYRFFRDTKGAGVDVLLLSLADNLALIRGRQNLDQWAWMCQGVGPLLRDYYERYDQIIAPEPLLSGRDLLERFNMEPGPAVGRILRTLQEAQATGEVTTKEQALILSEEVVRKVRHHTK
ncbi:MAG: HD domain-containing protein [Anaerolineae bacterium]|nr:HD domain-containing protein [Anaerolineae bacterium]